MTTGSGGRFDKAGNDYERLWVVLQMLKVLHGEAKSVLWEGLGPDERGVECWVRENDGSRTGHQCKRQHGGRGNWTVAALSREKVIRNALFQMERDISHRFAFVSHDPAPCLEVLINGTPGCNHDVSLYGEFLRNLSKDCRKEFQRLGPDLEANPDSPEGLKKAFDFLSRLEVFRFDRGKRSEEEVRSWARLTVDGDAGEAVRVLEEFARENIGNEVHADQIVDHLHKEDFVVLSLSGQPQLIKRVEELRSRFRRSLELLVIGPNLINRPQTPQLLDGLLASGGPRVVCLHGTAGYGKSMVLLELTKKLDELGIPYLPLRLDRTPPQNNLEYYSKAVCGLPLSLGVCLKEVAAERPAVLILDQLDAIRWTSAHSVTAWEVCESVIEDALAFRNVRVVVACRTFDWTDDPRFRALKSGQNVREIVVGELDEAEVKNVVEQRGGNWEGLAPKQRSLLRSPQNLYLWTRLPAAKRHGFRGAVDLMKEYWHDVRENRLQQAKVLPNEVESVLTAMVEYMDAEGRLSAPETLVAQWPRARDFLVSLDIIGHDEGQVLFRHQSHFDYLLAERLLGDIHRRQKTVYQWVKDQDQSLFRREQLRLILTLLRDEDHDKYLQSIRELALAGDIRFHLKMLVLQFLGQQEGPSESESSIVLEWLDDPKWKDHVLDRTVWNKAGWFRVLDNGGCVDRWLSSEDEQQQWLAINMVSLRCSDCGDIVVATLKRFENEHRPGLSKLACVLRFSEPSEENAGLFAARLAYVRKQCAPLDHIDWKRLSQKNPRRCVKLLRAIFSTLPGPDQDREKNPRKAGMRGMDFGYADLMAVAEAVENDYRYSWAALVGYAVTKKATIDDVLRKSYCYYEDDLWTRSPSWGLADLFWGLDVLMSKAGGRLARTAPQKFFEKLNRIYPLLPAGLRRWVLVALLQCPDNLSDQALTWLTNNINILQEDVRVSQKLLRAARDLIARFSGHCSAEVLQALETCVVNYKDPYLRRSYEVQQRALKEGWMHPNCSGRVQYYLMTAIPQERLSDATRSRMGQWKEKFRGTPVFETNRITGGAVTSPIPRDKLHLVSDKQWLDIVCGRWERRERHVWKAMGPGHIGERDHEHYASDMGHLARRQQKRFARLALSIPRTADPHYFAHILYSLAQQEEPQEGAPTGGTSPHSSAWVPATSDELNAVLEHVGFCLSPDVGMAFCSLLRQRSDVVWSAEVIRLLKAYAMEHPHPAPDEFPVQRISGPQQGPDITSSAINCVRGGAAGAIQSLLFERRELLVELLPAIRSLVGDHSICVRLAAIDACLPALNIDRDLAVELFLRACSTGDDRIFLGDGATRFMSYVWHTHLDGLQSVLTRMVDSDLPEVTENAGTLVAIVWLRSGQLGDLYQRCVEGNAYLRKGVADVAAQLIGEDACRKQCIGLLSDFFDDPDSDVRSQISRVFFHKTFEYAEAVSLCMAFAKSKAFEEHAAFLLANLGDFPGRVRPYQDVIVAASKRFSEEFAEATRDMSRSLGGDATHLAKVLLRLYEEAKDAGEKQTQEVCLDLWDKLLEARVGWVEKALEDMVK